jgi:hypothetical protein
MFRQSGGGRRRISEAIAKFREKGATSPEKAMTAQELGLPPRFEEAMKRRLGTTGIFVELGGKYYLDEARLRQVEQQRAASGMERRQETRSGLFVLRMARTVIVAAALILVVANILFVDSAPLRVIVVVLIVLWLVLTALQYYYVSRMRNREYSSGFNETPS